MAAGVRIPKGGARYYSAVVNVAAADTELVTAETGKRFIVHGVFISGDAAGIVSFVSDGSGDTEIFSARLTALSAAGELSAIVLPFSECGWFSTLSGEALDLRLATTANADGVVVYSEASA